MDQQDLENLGEVMKESGYGKATILRSLEIIRGLPHFKSLDPLKVKDTIVNYTTSAEVLIQRDPRYHTFLEECGKLVKIKDSVIEEGINDKVNIEKALSGLVWHLKRAQGIGGSDVGIIAYGSDGFSTKNDILQAKRIEGGIGEVSEHTLRGTLLEPIANSIYENRMRSQYGDKFVRLSDTVDGTSIHSWAVGNTDFRALVMRDDNTVDYIIDDYKCPKAEKAEKYKKSEAELPKGYVAQLHHYAMGAILGDSKSILAEIQEHFPEIQDIDQVNIKIGLLTIDLGAFEPVVTSLLERDVCNSLISQETYDTLTFIRAMLSAHHKEASIHRTPVVLNKKGLLERNETLNEFWEAVVAGEVRIEEETKGKEVLDAEELGIDETDVKRLVVLNAINKVSKKEEDNLAKSIKETLADNGYLGDISLGSGILKFNLNKPRVTVSVGDEQALIKALEEHPEFDIENCKVIDQKALLNLADVFGVTEGIKTKESTGNAGFPTPKSEGGIALRELGEEMLATIDMKIEDITCSEDVKAEASGVVDMDNMMDGL